MLSPSERDAMLTQVLDLRDKIGTLERQTMELKFRLQPVREKERNLRERIQATHGGPGTFNARRAPDRKPLFEGLLQISVDHGFTKNSYRDMVARMRAYERQADSIERKLAKDGGKKGHGAVSTGED